MPLTLVGTTPRKMVPPDKTQSGGFIPPDKTQAGLATTQTLSPDPAVAEGQAASMTPVP